jgi:radical SAM protein with 4Fe4S-binding SPASM domain
MTEIRFADSLESVNLALSNLCGADCIFCPKSPKKLPSNLKIMPIETAKKIIDEIAKKDSATQFVKKLEVGENGDALINPNFLEILRYSKLKNPKLFTNIYTNFQNFKPDISEVVVREKLLDGIVVSIDGHDSESYYKMKKLDLSNTLENIKAFVEARKKHDATIPLNVNSITYAQYVSNLYKKYGSAPLKSDKKVNSDDQFDDFKLIKSRLRKILDLKLDSHRRATIILWAERETVMANQKTSKRKIDCPKIKQIASQCYIAPNGDWYACCLNELQNKVFGNINEKTLNQIFFSKERQNFLRLLSNRKFSEIGYPCNMVETCQIIPLTFKEKIENYYNHVTFRLQI